MKVYTKIAVIYIAVCTLYILTSDSIIYAISSDPEWLTTVQSYKGVAFVMLSGILIYFLVKFYFKSQLKSKTALEKTIRHYQLIFDKNPLPSFIIDPQKQSFLAVNKAAEDKYAVGKDEFLTTSLLDFIVYIDRGQFDKAIQRLSENNYSEILIHTKHKDGRQIPLQSFCQPIFYEGRDAVFIIALDVSTSKDSHQMFMDKLLDSLEEERSKVSGELHDGIKQYFGLIKGMLSSHISKNPSSRYIEKALEMADLGHLESRRLSHAIAPALGGMNLCDSLYHLIDNVNISSEINYVVRCEVAANPIAEISINIYRIVQEAINNIEHHSKAKNAVIELKEKNGHLFLEISDDGLGMGDDIFPRSMENLGMNMMKTRATKLHGIFEIFSNKEKGTLLKVRVPLVAENTIAPSFDEAKV